MSSKVAKIVADIALEGQSAEISSTTLYTPVAAGLFRLSGYIELGPSATTSTLAQSFWNDDFETGNAASMNATTGTPGSFVKTIRVAAGQAITFATFEGGSGLVLDYNLYLTLEEL